MVCGLTKTGTAVPCPYEEWVLAGDTRQSLGRAEARPYNGWEF
jgi:hypothetical protein